MSPSVVIDESTGLEKVLLKNENADTAEVYLHGGHITSWKSDGGNVENLFLSSKAIFKPPKAIRGGIPICFPQFGPIGPLDQHGFARNRKWILDPEAESNDSSVTILLESTEETYKLWPHKFQLRQKITLTPVGELVTDITVVNLDSKALSFTFALHTYFSVVDISEVRIEGLEALDYWDNLQGREKFTDDGDSISFDSEFDRVYLKAPPKVAIVDHARRITFILTKENLPDVVVWNPWKEKAKSMSDFGDEDYKKMVCVESGAIEKAVNLKPREDWHGQQRLRIVPSSFQSGVLEQPQAKVQETVSDSLEGL